MTPIASTGRARSCAAAALALCWIGVVGVEGDPARAETREAYVTNQIGNSLSILDVTKMAVSGEIKIDGAPVGIAFSPGGNEAYVTAPDSGDIAVVDTKTRSVVTRIPAG